MYCLENTLNAPDSGHSRIAPVHVVAVRHRTKYIAEVLMVGNIIATFVRKAPPTHTGSKTNASARTPASLDQRLKTGIT
jgi:hypothetical protein